MSNKVLKISEMLGAENPARKVDLKLLNKILEVEQNYRDEYGLTHETSYLYDCKISHINALLSESNIKVDLVDLANILKAEKDLRKFEVTN